MSERRWLASMVIAVVLIGGVSGVLGTMVNPATRTVTVEVPASTSTSSPPTSEAPTTTAVPMVPELDREPETASESFDVQCGPEPSPGVDRVYWRKCMRGD